MIVLLRVLDVSTPIFIVYAACLFFMAECKLVSPSEGGGHGFTPATTESPTYNVDHVRLIIVFPFAVYRRKRMPQT